MHRPARFRMRIWARDEIGGGSCRKAITKHDDAMREQHEGQIAFIVFCTSGRCCEASHQQPTQCGATASWQATCLRVW